MMLEDERLLARILAAIASHNHDDHIGGMDAVLADWPVGRYLYNGLDAPNRNAAAVLEWLAARGIPSPDPPLEPIVLGDAVIRVLPSPLAAQGDENNASLVVLVDGRASGRSSPGTARWRSSTRSLPRDSSGTWTSSRRRITGRGTG